MEKFVLKTKTAIKRIAAIGSGALLATSTFGIAGLAQLEDLPGPFIDAQGRWVGLIGVGADAAPGDIIGATNIAAAFAQQAVIGVGPGTAAVTGGKREDVGIGEQLNASTIFGSVIDDDDVAGLIDTTETISVGDNTETYDVHDEVRLSGVGVTGTPLAIETGLTFDGDEDWGDMVFMPLAARSVGYYYVFDDVLKDGTKIANATTTDTIVLQFLGMDLEITSASNTSMTAQVGQEFFMNVDDSVTVLGKTVKLLNVGEGANGPVVVSVDGVQQTIPGGSTRSVGGVRIRAKDTFFSDTKAERSATLIVGEDAFKSYTDGDEFIGEDEDDPNWVWDLDGLQTGSPTIGILFDQNLDDPDDRPPSVGGTEESTRAPGAVKGDTLYIPRNAAYVSIKLEGFEETQTQRYEIEKETEELRNSTGTGILNSAARVLHLHADGGGEDGFTVVGGDETDDVYIAFNASTAPNGVTWFWKDHDDGGKIKQSTTAAVGNGSAATKIASIEYIDSSIDVTVKPAADGLSFNLTLDDAPAGAGDGDLTMLVQLDAVGAAPGFITRVGKADPDNSDVQYNDSGTLRAIAGNDEDARTKGGTVIKAINAENNPIEDIEIWVSEDNIDFDVNVLVSGPGTRVTAARGGPGVVQPIAGVPIARLDTEIADPTAWDLILVGGTAVNRLTARALGVDYPSFGQAGASALGIGEDEATIKVVENAFGGSKVAMIVAGWSAADTRNAAAVLQDFQSYRAQLTGDQVVVRSEAGVLQVSAPSVAAA